MTGAACSTDADCGTGPLANCGVCEFPAEGNGALEVNALEPSDVCVRKLLPGSTGTAYPLARKLYLNSLEGFASLTTQTLASPHSELELAQCFSNDSIVHPIIRDVGFITIGNISAQPGGCANDASLFCEATCASSCADNGTITTNTAPVDLAPGYVVSAGSCP
jgi:hypothetical protein